MTISPPPLRSLPSPTPRQYSSSSAVVYRPAARDATALARSPLSPLRLVSSLPAARSGRAPRVLPSPLGERERDRESGVHTFFFIILPKDSDRNDKHRADAIDTNAPNHRCVCRRSIIPHVREVASISRTRREIDRESSSS